VKRNLSLALILCLSVLVISCSKEAVPGNEKPIIGTWKNTAIYSDPAQGGHGWETVSRMHEYVTFNPNAKFNIVTDIPERSGTYQFSETSNQLQLNFEADQYGNKQRSETRSVETITSGIMILSFESAADGRIYKTEYTRIN
jgi:hypothetical protein